MSKTTIQMAFDAEKLTAIKLYAEKKEANLDAEFDDFMQKLYDKYVPVAVREYIEWRSAEETKSKPQKPPKPSRPRSPKERTENPQKEKPELPPGSRPELPIRENPENVAREKPELPPRAVTPSTVPFTAPREE